MKNKTIIKPNNDYRNAVILTQTNNRQMLDKKLNIKSEFYNNLTVDNYGNIIAVNGKKVAGGDFVYYLVK